MTNELNFRENCGIYLSQRWEHIQSIFKSSNIKEPLDDTNSNLKEKIISCLTSRTKSYRYVLPTQFLSKSVNHSLDCRSLQASDKSDGAYDARKIAHSDIVPFDSENHDVLGGSSEPYVNNPLRCTSVSKENRDRQKNKTDWDNLIYILDNIQSVNDVSFTKKTFDQILFEIHKLLSDVNVIYSTPSRISLDKTIDLIFEFISEKSGGERLESVATALFKTIAQEFSLFDEVKREKVNAADVSSGMVADIECKSKGQISLLVEIKDRNLTLTQLNAKIDLARAHRIKEIIFMAQQGIEESDKNDIINKIQQEFTSGQNIYVTNLIDFSRGILTLLGENGRVTFLNNIGPELNFVKAPIIHRRAWAILLRSI